MISLTVRAASQLKTICESEGIEHTSIRVKVIGGGCAGMTNDMTFDPRVTEEDETFESLGFTIVTDSLSHQYLDGTEIDWVDQGYSAGFKFLSPNAKSSCGCGNSQSY